MRKILILLTGGTIASVQTPNGLEPLLSAEQLLGCIPDLGGEIALETLQICSLDSTNMDSRYWLQIAAGIEKNYDAYDGFVVCHGTDTMAYTAAALSYLIQSSPKPIVLTGAQKPIQVEITDAKRNLADSIRYAADPGSSGVCLVFDGRVIAGTRAKKTKSFSYHAFSSINFPELASMQRGEIVRFIPGAEPGPVRFYHSLNPGVFALKLTPGIRWDVLDAVLEHYPCLILESFGVGGVPDSIADDLCRLMERHRGDRLLVMTTQVTYEGSDLSIYEVGRWIQERFPFLEAYDMNFEAVFTKLMWILGQNPGSFAEIRSLFYQKINYDVLL